jgi:hypothetical protein
LHEQVATIAAGGGDLPVAPTLATVQRMVAGVLTIMMRDGHGDA